MLAENNNALSETAQTLYELNADEITEMKCRARRDYYKQKNTTEKIMSELHEEVAILVSERDKLSAENDKLNSENDKLNSENDKLNSENDKLSSENDKLSSEIEILKARLAELENK